MYYKGIYIKLKINLEQYRKVNNFVIKVIYYN